MQRFQADNRDEGLHGVVSEHAATTAVAGAGFARDPLFQGVVIASGDLKTGNNINGLMGHRIHARTNWAIRHDDRGPVMFQNSGQGANGRFITGNDGDGSFQAAGT